MRRCKCIDGFSLARSLRSSRSYARQSLRNWSRRSQKSNPARSTVVHYGSSENTAPRQLRSNMSSKNCVKFLVKSPYSHRNNDFSTRLGETKTRRRKKDVLRTRGKEGWAQLTVSVHNGYDARTLPHRFIHTQLPRFYVNTGMCSVVFFNLEA